MLAAEKHGRGLMPVVTADDLLTGWLLQENSSL
jgi:hypothetical protein